MAALTKQIIMASTKIVEGTTKPDSILEILKFIEVKLTSRVMDALIKQ